MNPLRATSLRRMSKLRHLRGWQRLAESLAERSGPVSYRVGTATFQGDLSSFIERQAFLFGGYERDLVDLFLSRVRKGGLALDVGANIGNHTAFFAEHFDNVLAFEPNPIVIEALRRNLRSLSNVTICTFGLSETAGNFPFYNISNGNAGLGTFSDVEQYDASLERAGMAELKVADEFLAGNNVAAVKIDVQGFEANVLRGMRLTLEKSKPIVWVEWGAGTKSDVSSRLELENLFPYRISLEKFETSGTLVRKTQLNSFLGDQLDAGNYLVSPED